MKINLLKIHVIQAKIPFPNRPFFPDALILDLGIMAHCVKWKQCEKSVQKDSNKFADLVTTQPRYYLIKNTLRFSTAAVLEEYEIDYFIGHIQRVLHPGPYFDIFTNMID